MERPFAALGLGLCAHELEPQTRTTAAFVRSVHGTLEHGLHRRRGSADAIAAYAVGLGLSRAKGARDAISKRNARIVATVFNRVDCLARHAHRLSQLRLAPLFLSAQHAQAVYDLARHDSAP